jgi:hypothetical protein
LDAQVLSGVKISPSNGKVSVSLGSKVRFSTEAKIQSDIASLISTVFDGKTPAGRIGASGLFFGSDNESKNVIDTFSKVRVGSDLSSLLPTFNISSPLPLPSFSDIAPTNFEFSVHDPSTLKSSFGAIISNLPFDIQIKFPYLHLNSKLSGNEFLDLTFPSFSLMNSKLEGSVLVHFSNSDEANNALVNRVSDILFHQTTSYNDTLTVRSVQFGPKNGAIQAFSAVSLTAGVGKYIKDAGLYFDDKKPMDFVDLHTSLELEGIEVLCSIKPLPFPIIVDIDHIAIDIAWQVGGVGKVYRTLSTKVDLINLPAFHVFAIPDLDPVSGALEPLQDLVLNMLSFKEFVGNARFNALNLVGKDGTVFSPFYNTFFKGPPSFSIPPPLMVDLMPYQEPLKIALSCYNPTSLHLDMGQAEIVITNGNGGRLVFANSTTDIVALNINEGGNGTSSSLPPTLAIFDAELDPDLLGTIFGRGGLLANLPAFIVSLFRRKPNFALLFNVEVHIRRHGRDIPYIQVGTKYLLTNGLIDKLLPIVGVILANVKISIQPDPSDGEFRVVRIMDQFPEVGAAVDEYLGKSPLPSGLIIKGH